MKVAVIAPGEMGAAIGARLRANGLEVVTSLAGRGAASRERAARAGLVDAATDAALIRGTDLLLSIVPPAEALKLADRLAPALRADGAGLVYVDCNAVAPETVRAVAQRIEAAGAAFVDVGIIGGPPRGGDAGPRLYASGPAADRLAPLVAHGLDIRPMAGGIGAASALKMAYGSLTKGLTALGVTMEQAASRGGVAEALRAELAASQPELLAWLSRQVPRMYPKAYRWVAEMQEVARVLDGHAGADAFAGIARVYADIAQAGGKQERDFLSP